MMGPSHRSRGARRGTMVQRRMSPMVQITEAIFSQGVLKPVDKLQLREEQRVRLIIEPVDVGGGSDRTAALNRLRVGIASMKFSSSGAAAHPRRAA